MFRPESQGELLDTAIGMMVDNDLSMELEVDVNASICRTFLRQHSKSESFLEHRFC